MTKLAVLLVLSCAGPVLAQGKIPQRPSGSECLSGAFTVGKVRLCNLRDVLSSVPMVFVDGRYELLDLRSGPDDTPGFGWVGAAVSKGLWVGVLDWQVESSGEELVLVVSNDAGKSWTRLPAVKKPHYMALFRGLELKSARHWVLTIALEDCADCGVRVGTRRYVTHDGGGHWAPVTPVTK